MVVLVTAKERRRSFIMNIYVGNLPYEVDDTALKQLFAEYGSVTSAKVIIDREMNRSKGFGFVEMSDRDAAAQAITALDGSDLNGRSIKVNSLQSTLQHCMDQTLKNTDHMMQSLSQTLHALNPLNRLKMG